MIISMKQIKEAKVRVSPITGEKYIVIRRGDMRVTVVLNG